MDWTLPALPAVLVVVLNFVSPYVVSLLSAWSWTPTAKKIVAVVTSFVVSGAIIAIALWVEWMPLDTTPIGIVTLFVIGLLLQQVAYKNFLQDSATELMRTHGIGKVE